MRSYRYVLDILKLEYSDDARKKQVELTVSIQGNISIGRYVIKPIKRNRQIVETIAGIASQTNLLA
jgi:methyl-accepting chemotaxis protein